MIFKKAIVTTSGFLASAVLLTQFYSYADTKMTPERITYSGLYHLAENIKSLQGQNNKNDEEINKEKFVTGDVINLIDNEIAKKIKQTNLTLKTNSVASLPRKNFLVKRGYAKFEDLTKYEINNQELVKLKKFNSNLVALVELQSIKLASTYYNEEKDVVELSQSSTGPAQKIADEVKLVQQAVVAQEEIKEEDNELNDDLVMFDYGKNKEVKPFDKKLYDRPISNTVKEVIQREISNSVNKAIPVSNPEKNKEAINEYPVDTIKRTESAVKKEEQKEEQKETNSFLMNTHFTLTAQEIDLNTQKNQQAFGFEFVPDYERGERLDDQASGNIVFEYPLNGKTNILSGVIVAKGRIPTRVELNLNTQKLEVPLISEENIQKFLQKENVNAEGGIILLGIDSSIIDIELDTKYDQRLYFNNNFKLAEKNEDAHFVMYLGVKSGNTMVRYLLQNNEDAQKVVYVGPGEMYFEDPSFKNGQRETFIFTTRNILGQKGKELIINGADISYVNTKIIAKKKALNAYEIKIPKEVSGTRKYLGFKHLKDQILVGSSDTNEIEIPDNDFIAKIMEISQVDSLKNRCMVQINLVKQLSSLTAGGKNSSGEMYVETKFLDVDGNFSDNSELSEKAFVVGDLEGLFSLRLDYTDGSTEFLKTYCTEATYLVEQL